jgi:flavin reductase (DIM6/NTAB) family NADH-FMN oxidoreductase RutF
MFEKIDVKTFAENPFKLIGDDWMIISADDGEVQNGMTASWGEVGVLFNKPVCTCYIRPQRYTYKVVENTDKLTFAFFDESYRKTLAYFGSKSGYDEDKIAVSKLTPIRDDGYIWYDEARLVIKAKKIYADDIKEECFIDKSKLDTYKNNDYHRFYICDIMEILKKV